MVGTRPEEIASVSIADFERGQVRQELLAKARPTQAVDLLPRSAVD